MEYFTIGEIVRKKILIGKRGKAYTDKAATMRALKARFPTLLKKPTLHGLGYSIPQSMIEKFNKANTRGV